MQIIKLSIYLYIFENGKMRCVPFGDIQKKGGYAHICTYACTYVCMDIRDVVRKQFGGLDLGGFL